MSAFQSQKFLPKAGVWTTT